MAFIFVFLGRDNALHGVTVVGFRELRGNRFLFHFPGMPMQPWSLCQASYCCLAASQEHLILGDVPMLRSIASLHGFMLPHPLGFHWSLLKGVVNTTQYSQSTGIT